jgi:hypothetical protein
MSMTRDENEKGSEGSRYLLRGDHLIRSVYLVYSLVVEKSYSSSEYLRLFGIQNSLAFSFYNIELGFFQVLCFLLLLRPKSTGNIGCLSINTQQR